MVGSAHPTLAQPPGLAAVILWWAVPTLHSLGGGGDEQVAGRGGVTPPIRMQSWSFEHKVVPKQELGNERIIPGNSRL